MTLTLIIVILTSLVSIAGFSNPQLTSKLIFHPYSIKNRNEWYRFFTSGVLHADFLHLFVNMFVLFSFGQAVEHYYAFVFGYPKGMLLYLLLYISGIAAANVSTYYKYNGISSYHSLGASGAVSAVLFASIVFNPYSPIYLYGLLPIPGIVAALLYLGYSQYMNQRGGDNINHEAHFYGGIYGFVFTIVFKPALFLAFIRMLFFMH